MFYFSPTFFGSLHLSFNYDKSKIVSSDFVGSLLNSPASGKFQRLHFYIHNRRGLSEEIIKNLNKAIEMKSELINGRPWCENLLPFIEIPNHPSIIQSNSEMIFVQDRYPKVKFSPLIYKLFFILKNVLGKCSFFMFTKKKN